LCILSFYFQEVPRADKTIQAIDIMASKASLTVYTKSASPAPLGAIALANYIPGNQISVSYEAESEDKAVAAVLKSDT
jgi:hypothetical protein